MSYSKTPRTVAPKSVSPTASTTLLHLYSCTQLFNERASTPQNCYASEVHHTLEGSAVVRKTSWLTSESRPSHPFIQLCSYAPHSLKLLFLRVLDVVLRFRATHQPTQSGLRPLRAQALQNLWALVKAKIYKLYPELKCAPNTAETLEQLIRAAKEAQQALDTEILVKLSDTMPNQVKAVIMADGGILLLLLLEPSSSAPSPQMVSRSLVIQRATDLLESWRT